MWNEIWNIYWKDWSTHSKEELIIQVLSIFIILFLGTIAIRILGKKSVAQMTLLDVLFIFVLSSTLGALITNPKRILVAFLVIFTIILFVFVLQKMPMKSNRIERMLISSPEILFKDGEYNEHALRRNNLTVDMIESFVRQRGYASVEICKTVVIEPTGAMSFEVLPQYENTKVIQFESAIQQILDAIDGSKYKPAQMPEMNNPFSEIEGGKNNHKKPVAKHLE